MQCFWRADSRETRTQREQTAAACVLIGRWHSNNRAFQGPVLRFRPDHLVHLAGVGSTGPPLIF